MLEESAGIRKLVSLLYMLYDAMTHGKVLICDDIESSLHESVVYFLLDLFTVSQRNQNAQLIFTTHCTGILTHDLFRRDQIWFTELDPKERATDLYSLLEIKNTAERENFSKGYISGKYGAIPVLNPEFLGYFLAPQENEK